MIVICNNFDDLYILTKMNLFYFDILDIKHAYYSESYTIPF